MNDEFFQFAIAKIDSMTTAEIEQGLTAAGFKVVRRSEENMTTSTRATAAQPDEPHFYTFKKPEGWISLSGQTWEEWTKDQGPPTARGWKVLGKQPAQQHSGNSASTGRDYEGGTLPGPRFPGPIGIRSPERDVSASTVRDKYQPKPVNGWPSSTVELDVEAERRELMQAFEREYLPLKTNSLDKIIKRRAELAAFEKGWLAARTAATSTAPDKLDTDAEKLDFATTFDVDEFMREYSKYGPEVAAFSIWLAARAGNFLNSGAATSTQAERSTGCACQACNPRMVGKMMFICPACGDKRCPHAADHRTACPTPRHSPVGAKEQDK